MHEKRFQNEVSRLRDPDRVARLEVDRVVELAGEGLPAGTSLLDVGTGSGLFAEAFAAKGFRVTGIDANPAMVAAAEKQVPAGTFQVGTAEELPFPNQSFDLVFMGLSLHEADDPQQAVREAFRVTQGKLVVLEWPPVVESYGPPAAQRLSEADLLRMGQNAGFQRAEPKSLSHFVLYLFIKSI